MDTTPSVTNPLGGHESRENDQLMKSSRHVLYATHFPLPLVRIPSPILPRTLALFCSNHDCLSCRITSPVHTIAINGTSCFSESANRETMLDTLCGALARTSVNYSVRNSASMLLKIMYPQIMFRMCDLKELASCWNISVYFRR